MVRRAGRGAGVRREEEGKAMSPQPAIEDARAPRPADASSATFLLVLATVVVVALYFGRDIFLPLALAVLLSFALTPAVRWLRRRRIGRIPSVLVVVVFAFSAIAVFGAVVATRVVELAGELPYYQYNIARKLEAIREAQPGRGLVERASEMLRELSDGLKEKAEREAAAAPAPGGEAPAEEAPPVRVQVVPGDPPALEVLQSIAGPLIKPLTTGGIVIVFVIFMLAQWEDLRDRFILLASGGDLRRTTEALDDATRRVSRYLLMQLLINSFFGFASGLGLWLIGVPNAELWGMLSGVLRFVPYIGPIVAASFPILLAVAVDPGWNMLLWVAALYIALELLTNNLLEPWLYGSGTGLSPLAVIVAAIFWTWLWGPLGLLLSTPLTVCMVVIGRHVPRLRFVGVLFGNEPVLSLSERLYQRLLAGDPDEAAEQAEDYLTSRPLLAFYDEVALPALALAELDRARGHLDERRLAVVAASAMTLVDDLDEHAGTAPTEEPVPDGGTVLCIGPRNELDEAAATMLAQLLEQRGILARTVGAEMVSSARLGQLPADGVRFVCLSYMNAESLAHARFTVRRLRRRLPDAPILVALWAAPLDAAASEDARRRVGAQHLAVDLAQALAAAAGVRAGEQETGPAH